MTRLSRDKLHEAINEEERTKREESATRRLLNESRKYVAVLEEKVDLLTAIDGIECKPAEWAQPKQAKDRHAIANLLFSDLHLDEVVDPGQMRGRNAYNREIAHNRLKRLADGTIKMARDHLSGVTYDGLYVWSVGDNVSGNIHAELRRTNVADVIDTCDYWIDPLAGFYKHLADYFKKVHVVSVPGNHARSTDKPEAKGRVRSSFDWMLNRGIYRELRKDNRFSWNFSESADVFEQQYDTRYLAQHGDDFKGGDQIAGAVRPVMMGDYRALVAEMSDVGGQPYDVLLVGHFHQYIHLPRAIVNGSLIGYNEYAKDKKIRPEPPQQAFWLTTPEYGVGFHLPIKCRNRDEEGW